MGSPTLIQRLRQTIGRALRETGQAIDRLAIRGESLAISKRVIGDDPVIYQDFLNRHRHQMPLLRRGRPVISKDVAFLAPCSTLIGSVYVGAGSSIFYKSILRADNCENSESFKKTDDELLQQLQTQQEQQLGEEGNDDEQQRNQLLWTLDDDRFTRQHTTAIGGGIFIGTNTNIQDGCIIDSSNDHTIIGNGVTVGHLASIHSSTIHDHCLIGMGSVLQEGVVVNEESFIAAGAVIPANTVVDAGELWVGNPARKVRDLTADERQRLHYQANEYVGVAGLHNGTMELGGNLPDSLSQYLVLGHGDNTTEEDDQEDDGDEKLKVGN